MKKLVKNVIPLVGGLAFIGFILFVLQFRTAVLPPEIGSHLLQAPAVKLASKEPYPEHIGRSAAGEDAADCSKAGSWITHDVKEAGISFQYPAESIFMQIDGPDGYPNIAIGLKPFCYPGESWGPRQLSIILLNNDRQLSIDDFVKEQFPSFASTIELTELNRSMRPILVDQVRAIRISGKITNKGVSVYIPNESLVIYMGISDHNIPPYTAPAPTTLELFNQILASIQVDAPETERP